MPSKNLTAQTPVTPVVVASVPKQESALQIALNKHMIGYLQTHKGRYLLGDNFLEITLASRKAESGEKRAEIAEAAELLVNGESVKLADLKDSDAITFTVRIIRNQLNTTFSHEVLKAHNETSFEREDKFAAYTDGVTIALERDSFLGETINAKTVLALILNYVKLGKTQQSSQKWRKRTIGGVSVYEKSVNGQWVKA